jgi:hypothetical protein
MLAKSTRRSPWLVGIWAEVARLQSVLALRAAPRRGSFKQDACANGEGLSYYSLTKLTILVVDRGGPEYSTSYRRAFHHSFAPARLGGGPGGGWAFAHEGSNPSPSARISPVLSTLLNRGFNGPGGCLCRETLRKEGCAARLGAIVPKGVPHARPVRRRGLPEALGTSTMRILAPVGCYERQRRCVHCFPILCM